MAKFRDQELCGLPNTRIQGEFKCLANQNETYSISASSHPPTSNCLRIGSLSLKIMFIALRIREQPKSSRIQISAENCEFPWISFDLNSEWTSDDVPKERCWLNTPAGKRLHFIWRQITCKFKLQLPSISFSLIWSLPPQIAIPRWSSRKFKVIDESVDYNKWDWLFVGAQNPIEWKYSFWSCDRISVPGSGSNCAPNFNFFQSLRCAFRAWLITVRTGLAQRLHLCNPVQKKYGIGSASVRRPVLIAACAVVLRFTNRWAMLTMCSKLVSGGLRLSGFLGEGPIQHGKTEFRWDWISVGVQSQFLGVPNRRYWHVVPTLISQINFYLSVDNNDN